MTPAQDAALTQLLEDQQNPASPRYHQWLTPEQFGAQFGMPAADLAKVSSWLTAQGFTVTEVARGGTYIRFSGNVGLAQTAFHTSIHNVSLNGQQHFANLTEPSLPAAIAAVTSAITGLHDFHPVPHHHYLSVPAPAGVAASTNALGARFTDPSYTSSVSGNHFIAPGDFYTIYDENALLTSSVTGSGVTIAVMGQTDVVLSDIAAFRSVSGLPVNAPTVSLYGTDPGVPSTNDQVEAELDLEWSGATAPGASIVFVNSKDVIDISLVQAINNNLAPIISLSYGVCESAVGQSLLNSYNTLMKQANAQGQTVLCGVGRLGCDGLRYQVA